MKYFYRLLNGDLKFIQMVCILYMVKHNLNLRKKRKLIFIYLINS